MGCQHCRRGISLVEILIVIAIIGLLVSLSLPAIQASRESARRVQCINNLRQFGTAMTSFESQYKAFPAGATIRLKGPLGVDPEITAYTFIVELLPFLEETSLDAMYDRNAMCFAPQNLKATATPISIAICPSAPDRDIPVTMSFLPSALVRSPDPRITGPLLDALDAKYMATFDAAISDYTVAVHADEGLANSLGYSQLDSVRELPSMFPVPTSDELLRRLPGALISAGVVEFGEGIRAAQITDGLSRTLSVFEVAGRPQHWNQGVRITTNEPLTNAWADPRIVIKIRTNKLSELPGLVNVDNNDHPYSFHPGGANAAFADGHVEFLSETIEPRVLLSLMTPAQDDNPDE